MPKNYLTMTVVKPGYGPGISEWNNIISWKIVSATIHIKLMEILTMNKFVQKQLLY